MSSFAHYLPQVRRIAREAGEAIMTIYQRDDFDVQIKSDDSPLTAADMASHRHIVAELEKLTPDIPILSEESEAITFEERSAWPTFWLIDPLDGTKEFVARNDEFTVNIALVHNHVPVLGVVQVPAKKAAYYAAEGAGAFVERDGQSKPIAVRSCPVVEGKQRFTIVASRRHGFEKVEAMANRFPSYELTSVGSALKLCLVAEGLAELYPRLALTSEWDTAAAQIVVTEAGGVVCDLDFAPLRCNTKESILNPFFLVLGDPEIDWKELLGIDRAELEPS